MVESIKIYLEKKYFKKKLLQQFIRLTSINDL